MSLVHLSKAAIAGIASAALASTGAVAWAVVDHGTKHTTSAVHTVDGSLDASRSNVSGVVGGVGGTSGSTGADGSGSGANGSASAGNGTTSASATGGGVSGGGSTSAGGGIAVNAGGAGLTSSPSVNSTGSGTGTGGLPTVGSGGGGVNAPSLPAPGVTVPTTPGTPTAPDAAALYREGSYTLPVPGTPGVSKKLCLNGEVSRCQAVTVPSLQPTNVTVSYSNNAATSAPSFDVVSCQGGAGVTVSGITPGTTVTVEARGVTVSRTLGSREVSQSASLCDA